MGRTVIIGLDGATFTILDELTADRAGEGVVMPFLKSIMATGYRATLRSTNHPLTPPAWVSLMTGRTPGHHGVYDFVRFEDLGHDVYFTLYDARDIRQETLWEIASRNGQQTVSLNFPMMAPPPEIKGSLIPGFVSWKHLRRNVWPQSLYDRISALPEFNVKELCWDFKRESKIGEAMANEELYDWVECHLPRERQWFKIASYLLEDDEPDLMAVMFDGTDKIQHQAWHLLDPAIWREDAPESSRRIRALVIRYFRELDGYIEKLVELAGPDAQVFIMSDHGFTGSDKLVRINRYLGELGYLKWREDDGSNVARRREDSDFANLDWSETLAFCPTPSSNGIFIRRSNESGKSGVTDEQYDAFREKLIEDLRKLKDPATGQNVISNILVREEAFPGPQMHGAPDLTLVLADFGFVSVRNAEPAVVDRPVPFGTHHPDGIFLAHGPGINAAHGQLMSITDVTAIAVHNLGIAVPSNFEGRIPPDLFTAEHQSKNPVRVGEPTRSLAAGEPASAKRSAHEPSDAEKEEILKQLRALGYLGD